MHEIYYCKIIANCNHLNKKPVLPFLLGSDWTGNTNDVESVAGESGNVTLSWDDPWPTVITTVSQNQYLYLIFKKKNSFKEKQDRLYYETRIIAVGAVQKERKKEETRGYLLWTYSSFWHGSSCILQMVNL